MWKQLLLRHEHFGNCVLLSNLRLHPVSGNDPKTTTSEDVVGALKDPEHLVWFQISHPVSTDPPALSAAAPASFLGVPTREASSFGFQPPETGSAARPWQRLSRTQRAPTPELRRLHWFFDCTRPLGTFRHQSGVPSLHRRASEAPAAPSYRFHVQPLICQIYAPSRPCN